LHGVCEKAAEGGHLQVLQWAVEQGCDMDQQVCSAAALYGHLELLKWARQHGAPWDEDVCTLAAGRGDLEMLQWATTGPGRRFPLIVHHTDAEREWACERTPGFGELDKALREARTKGWIVVDMKRDWKKVYAFE
jgi:hypothetical protein